MKDKHLSTKLHNLRGRGKKALALLIDPDSVADGSYFTDLLYTVHSAAVDFFFVGGSLAGHEQCRQCVESIKSEIPHIPVILFPGNAIQVVDNADGILFLSLISGRNPELLIGQQVAAAPFLAQSSLEILPTGYMLVDSGELTSVNYMSQTIPLPQDKPGLAVATALAGSMLGLSHLFLDAGSGAKRPVSPEIISAVKSHTSCPLIVGGGINTAAKAKTAWQAGADVVVIGNGAEKNPNLLIEVLAVAQMYNLSLNVN
jgi:phosphoglycerol geranylgeranyltransferase